MLTYLLGDVLRIFSGDFAAGENGDMQVSEAIYLRSHWIAKSKSRRDFPNTPTSVIEEK